VGAFARAGARPRLALATALLAGSFVGAPAQEVLTLDVCLATASRGNPGLAAARAAVEKAFFARRASYGEFLPQVSAEASAARRRAEDDSGAAETESDAYGLSARQTLFAGGRNRAALDEATAAWRLAEADLSAAEAQVTYDVRSAFADLLFAGEQMRLAREIENRQRDNRDLLRLRYEGGRENKGAVLRTEAFLREAEADVALAGRSLRVSRRKLATVLGRSSGEALDIRGVLAAAGRPAMMDVEPFVEATPENRRAQADLDAAKARLASARSRFYPEVAAEGSVSRTGERWMPEHDAWIAGISLSYPLFSGGRDVMDRRGAQAEVNQAEHAIRAADAAAALALDQALADHEEAADRASVETGFLEAAAVRAEVARAQYDAGLMTFDEWDRIERELTDRRKSELAARKRSVLARANWEKTQGLSGLPP
jgi:outer membrane protein TolC